MTEGERRIYESLSPSRGSHTLTIIYTQNWPRCTLCRQAVRTDADIAYKMFCDASLLWDGKALTHNELRTILMDGETFMERGSGGSFRRPGEYGLDPVREWARRELGKTGVVLADIDIAVRRYGPRFGLNSNGDAMLIEKKERWPNEVV